MPKIYSRSGCFTCRARKKKCDEQKPKCMSCIRLHLTCSYDGPLPKRNPQLGEFEVKQNAAAATDLSTSQTKSTEITPSTDAEASIIARIPESCLQFFCPTVDEHARDMQVLMQLVLTNLMVRSSLIACFSAILPLHTPVSGDIDRRSLGTALSLMKSKLSGSLDRSDLYCATVSAVFLGLLDVAGCRELGHARIHFLGTAALLRRLQRCKHSPPQNLLTLSIETVVFNLITDSLFTRHFELIDRVWRRDNIGEMLLQIPKPYTSNSMFLGGQYELWLLTYDVMCSMNGSLTSELDIKTRLERVRITFPSPNPKLSKLKRQAMIEMYELHRVAVLICIAACNKDIDAVRLQATKAIKIFHAWTLAPMSYVTATWAISVLACAIESDEQRQIFDTKMEQVAPFITPGHMKRLHAVFAQIDAISEIELILPGALPLLELRRGWSESRNND